MSATTSRLPRVMIYGSCVARDTVEAAAGSVELVRYVARQSLISVGSDASAHLPTELGLDSPFQARMVTADFLGSLGADLTEVGKDVDRLLWDLADERHGVYRFRDGTIATRSVETMRSEALLEAVSDAEHLAFGSDEHFALWRAAANDLGARLRHLGLLERTTVLEVPWAERTVYGAPTPWSMGVRAADANARFTRYYEYVRSIGFATIRPDQSLVLADPDHRWGLAPFHYVPSLYLDVIDQLQTLPGLGSIRADK